MLVILVPALPPFILAGLLIVRDSNNARHQLQDSLVKLVATQAVIVDREITSTIDALTLLSYDENLNNADLSQFWDHLKSLPKVRPSWSQLYLLDANGRMLFSTLQDFKSSTGSTSEPHQTTYPRPSDSASGGPEVQQLQPNALNGDLVTPIQIPIRSADGKVKYFLGAWISASNWQNLLLSTGIPDGGFVTLSDSKQQIIARSPQGDQFIGTLLPSVARGALSNRSLGVVKTKGADGNLMYVAWQGTDSADWAVSVGVPFAAIEESLTNSIIAAGFGAAMSLAFGVALAWLISRRVTVPLRELAMHGAHGTHHPIAIREIAQLRDSLLSLEAQRQSAIERLQSTADELQALFNSSPIGLAIAQDTECKTVLTNPALQTMLGRADGEPWFDAKVRHEGRELGRDDLPLQQAAHDGKSIENVELEVERPNGKTTKLLAHAVPLRNALGEVRGAVAGYVDVTQRAEAESRFALAERRLRESRQMVELAQQAGQVGFFDRRFTDGTVTWTTGLGKLFGTSLSSFEGTWDDWMRHVDSADIAQVQNKIEDAIRAQESDIRFEFRTLLPNNTIRWLSIRCVLTYRKGGMPSHLIGVVMDVTDQILAERERAEFLQRQQEARVDAEKANKAKDEFLAMLGHELRNPLGAISSAAEVLNRLPDDDLAAKARTIILRQTRHLSRLMDDLLDVTRVIAGKILLSRAPADLSALVQRVVGTLELAKKLTQHKIELDLQPTWVMADSTRAEQVINNLLTNALKYTSPEGTIWIRVMSDDKWGTMIVTDNGMGMTSDLVSVVFDLFVQGDRSLDRRQGGLGIGLTLVKRLIELHDGHVSATSPGPNQGSTFTVRFPRCPAPSEAAVPQDTAIENYERTVVIVEDNVDACEALRTILEMDGHKVHTAHDGTTGLALILERQPDLALVDIGLPGLSGFEVASEIRKSGINIRLVALSGYGQAADIKQALDAGFDSHLVKPVDPRSLGSLFLQLSQT